MPNRLIQSVPQYMSAVLAIARRLEVAQEEIEGPWFRGANDRSKPLVPGAYRRGYREVQEEALVVDFMALAPPYLNTEGARKAAPESLWEWYFLMQHYGLPTRLLDWTENALVGLYFALEPPGPRPCVWVLDPAGLNEKMGVGPFVVTPGGDYSRHWLPIASDDQKFGCRPGAPVTFKYANSSQTNKNPMAIYAPRHNTRIVAQQGTFTIHGASRQSLNALLASRSSPLRRIDVSVRDREQLLDELALCGISGLSIFPELSQLAPHIIARFHPNP